MRNSLAVSLVLASGATIACSNRATTAILSRDFGTLNGAEVELTEVGGFAARSTTQLVRHDDGYFSYVAKPLCAPACPAMPVDSASGSLTHAASDSLFSIIVAASPGSLRDDYGATPNSADMVTYTLRISTANGVKTIRADDGTMPAPMRQIVEAVHGIIAAARQR
jgi:hypothetical protein